MTMHLLGPAFTTISTKKKKNPGITITAKFVQEFNAYNAQMKRLGSKQKTMDEYITYRKGNFKPKLRGIKIPKLEVSNHRDKYPSDAGGGTTFAKQPNMYTGTLIKGISTLHKSNAVPVISEEEMKEHSNMRR